MHLTIPASSDASIPRLPPPPRVPAFAAPTLRPAATSFPKECRCGRSHSASEWPRLDYCGVQSVGSDYPSLELRHCPCTSTIAVELEDVADDVPRSAR